MQGFCFRRRWRTPGFLLFCSQFCRLWEASRSIFSGLLVSFKGRACHSSILLFYCFSPHFISVKYTPFAWLPQVHPRICWPSGKACLSTTLQYPLLYWGNVSTIILAIFIEVAPSRLIIRWSGIFYMQKGWGYLWKVSDFSKVIRF